MAIREDLVSSAIQFLQDPSVATSSVENKVSFMRSKNLTQEEIDAALARAGGQAAPAPSAPSTPYQAAPAPGPPPPGYYPPYPPHAWQPPPPPQRDWRDWFIMATVVGSVSYGLYTLGKRYVYPLVAPPTPERLEQDKKSIEEQFDRAFTLVEQLAKDTDDLKKAEQERTEKLDTALSELETVMVDLKAANRRREEDSSRIRQEIQALQDSVPKALENQKELTGERLKEVNAELVSLKTLLTQRMNPVPPPPSGFLRGSSGGNVTPSPSTPAPSTTEPATNGENAAENGESNSAARSSRMNSTFRSTSGLGASGGKVSIPAWQMAMQKQNDTSSTVVKADENDAGN